MEEQFVNFMQAEKLDDIGICHCLDCFLAYYDEYSILTINIDGCVNSIPRFTIPAPLYQQVFDWFRDKHNLHVEIERYIKNDGSFEFNVQFNGIVNDAIYDENSIETIEKSFCTYKEARDAAINAGISIIRIKS